ncbi:MAG: tetratricopeptide repeat protein [Bacteroidetes bacterium]|nr:tetratricopeptide repeat protein [Bacteroidota bacterium]
MIFLYSLSTHAQTPLDCSRLSDGGSYNNSEKCFSVLIGTLNAAPETQYLRIKNLTRSGQPALLKQAEELTQKMDPAFDYSAIAQIWIYQSTNNAVAAKALAEKIRAVAKKESANKLVEVAEAFLNFKTTDPEFAFALLQQAESLMKPVSAACLIQKGIYYRSKGDHGSATTTFNIALDKELSNPLAHYFKGVSYAQIGSLQAALEEFNLVLKIQPEFPNAFREKAEVLLKLGQQQEGKDAYDSYFEYNPEDIYTRLNYGSALFASKDFIGANTQADNVLKQKSDFAAAYKLKAYCDYELSLFPEGIDHMNLYLSLIDSSLSVTRDYEYLGKLYQKNGNDSLAIGAFLIAVDKPGARSELFSETISLLSKKGKYNETIAVYDKKSMLFTPTSADSYNSGRAYLAIGNFASADSLFTKVCDLQPAWPNGFLMRGNANANLDPGSVQGKAKPTMRSMWNWLKVIL